MAERLFIWKSKEVLEAVEILEKELSMREGDIKDLIKEILVTLAKNTEKLKQEIKEAIEKGRIVTAKDIILEKIVK